MLLARVDRQDVVGGQRKIVQHRQQFAARQLPFDLPGRAPADADALADPAMQQFAVVAIERAVDRHRHRPAVLLEIPAALLAALQVECQAVVLDQLGKAHGLAVTAKIPGRAAHYPPVAGQLDRHEIRIDDPADADAQVVALAHHVDHPVGQVERDLQARMPLLERRPMRRHMLAAERGRCRHDQVAGGLVPFGRHLAFGAFELGHQPAALIEKHRALLGQRQPPG